MKCKIPAGTLPPCDQPWGHEGRMHANEGDGFYAWRFDAEHTLHQKLHAAELSWTSCMTCLVLGLPHLREGV
jgi:hypothetical protein